VLTPETHPFSLSRTQHGEGDGVPSDLIFDFFGTLVGYTPGPFRDEIYHATHQILIEHGYPVEYEVFVRDYARVSQRLDDEAKATCIEFHMHDAGRAFFTECFGKDAPQHVVERFAESFVTEWNRGTVHYSEIASFIERLSRRYRLSIISNTHYPSLITRNLDAMGITRYFARVVTSVELGVRKPDPRIFHHALKQLGIAPTDALYIGDNEEDDYQGATAIGMPCVLIDPDGRWDGTIKDRVNSLFEIEHLLAAAP
jgi:putative hydrolase of the HAD superfamily